MGKYSVYSGKFPCHTCKEEARSMRMYPDTGVGSWMCSKKHLTEVVIAKIGYKKKSNERKSGE